MAFWALPAGFARPGFAGTDSLMRCLDAFMGFAGDAFRAIIGCLGSFLAVLGG